jgi:GNAT superfamily N-acetyltransferase
MSPGRSPRHYALRAPESRAEWDAYHVIRQQALFEPYHPNVTYVRNHPDESKPGHYPLVLTAEGEVVGTVRVDLLDQARAALRLVAIHPDRQRQGLGAVLLDLAEDFIRRRGRRRVVVHGNPATIGFYLDNGYVECLWDDDHAMAGHIDVAKDL